MLIDSAPQVDLAPAPAPAAEENTSAPTAGTGTSGQSGSDGAFGASPNLALPRKRARSTRTAPLPTAGESPSPPSLNGEPPLKRKCGALEVNRELYVALYGAELINQAGIMLQLSQVVIATAQVIYHRFYRGLNGKSRSVKEFPPFLVAMACMYLATKVEEEQRRHRDILNVFDRLQKKRLAGKGRPLNVLDPYGKRYSKWRGYLMKLELVILCDLGYMLKTEHPHKYILHYVNVLDAGAEVAQKAWSYLNDSLRLPQTIDIRPEVLACASIFLAARHLKLKLPADPPWYNLFEAQKKDVEETANMIMALYTIPRHRFEKMDGEHVDPESGSVLSKMRLPPQASNGKKTRKSKAGKGVKSSKDKESTKDKEKKKKKKKRRRDREKLDSDYRSRSRSRRRRSRSRSRSRGRKRRRR